MCKLEILGKLMGKYNTHPDRDKPDKFDEVQINMKSSELSLRFIKTFFKEDDYTKESTEITNTKEITINLDNPKEKETPEEITTIDELITYLRNRI